MAPTLTTEIVPGPRPIVRVAGELDLSTAARLCQGIQQAIRGPRPRVVIDLTDVTFCDSTGLRALLGAVREVEVQGGKAKLVIVPGSALDRLLYLTGLREFADVAESANLVV